jgi:hypothetical protein
MKDMNPNLGDFETIWNSSAPRLFDFARKGASFGLPDVDGIMLRRECGEIFKNGEQSSM